MGQPLERELPRRRGTGEQLVRHRPLRKTVKAGVPLGGQQTVLEIGIGEVGVQVNRWGIPQGLEHHIHPTPQFRHADPALVRGLQEQQAREQMI